MTIKSGAKLGPYEIVEPIGAVSSLNHPNICTIHDVGREGETDYLVMELLEGRCWPNSARAPKRPRRAHASRC